MHSPKRRRPVCRLPHHARWQSGVYLLIALLYPLVHSGASAQSEALRTALQNQKRALELELAHVRSAPGAFYLVIDATARSVFLKADANLLRVCPIREFGSDLPSTTQIFRFVQHVRPVTTEPGNDRYRLRSRLLPLDFRGRLLEGPRSRSRLFFSPALVLLSPSGLPVEAFDIALDGTDIKALGSALVAGQMAIWIPPGSTGEPSP